MDNKNLYVDINILQTVPSSNINRDDTGAPKTAIYGGIIRSRVSSQSWKRAVRQAFAQESNNATWLDGIRTLYGPQLLADEIQKIDENISEEGAIDKAQEVFQEARIKIDKKKHQTKALLMLSNGQIEKLAKYVIDNSDIDSKAVKKVLQNDNSLDLALFGRMVAGDSALNVDASCQVAHAISTHEVTPEFDYYAAVDDKRPEDTAGSAMLGTIEYNSSTLYRYANVNVNELVHNLGNSEVALQGLNLFIKDFTMSMPSGHQNSFANKTVPNYVMVTLRTDTPVNLVSAFEDPVKSRDGFVQSSITKLEKEYSDTQKFVDAPLATYVLTTNKSVLNSQVNSLNELTQKISAYLKTRLVNENTDN
ncbi:type I-E CRISPR-associated protein Cas7/Cse4/CasC [Limosilactobacillus sp.]|uniref:type I-E CRISPR-associated protein Cas7/Cse4/CasC n=1 Tax=Limosilactobacillus sp. TaxID=2773925 RepID=UPI00345E39D7